MNNEEYILNVNKSNSRTLEILDRLMLPWINLVSEEPTDDEKMVAHRLTSSRLFNNPIKLTDEIINDAILIQINEFIYSGKFKPTLKNRIKFCCQVIGTCVNLTKDAKGQLISCIKNSFSKKLRLNDGDIAEVQKFLNKIHTKFGLEGLEETKSSFYNEEINTINCLFLFLKDIYNHLDFQSQL